MSLDDGPKRPRNARQTGVRIDLDAELRRLRATPPAPPSPLTARQRAEVQARTRDLAQRERPAPEPQGLAAVVRSIPALAATMPGVWAHRRGTPQSGPHNVPEIGPRPGGGAAGPDVTRAAPPSPSESNREEPLGLAAVLRDLRGVLGWEAPHPIPPVREPSEPIGLGIFLRHPIPGLLDNLAARARAWTAGKASAPQIIPMGAPPAKAGGGLLDQPTTPAPAAPVFSGAPRPAAVPAGTATAPPKRTRAAPRGYGEVVVTRMPGSRPGAPQVQQSATGVQARIELPRTVYFPNESDYVNYYVGLDSADSSKKTRIEAGLSKSPRTETDGKPEHADQWRPFLNITGFKPDKIPTPRPREQGQDKHVVATYDSGAHVFVYRGSRTIRKGAVLRVEVEPLGGRQVLVRFFVDGTMQYEVTGTASGQPVFQAKYATGMYQAAGPDATGRLGASATWSGAQVRQGGRWRAWDKTLGAVWELSRELGNQRPAGTPLIGNENEPLRAQRPGPQHIQTRYTWTPGRRIDWIPGIPTRGPTVR